MTAFLLYHFFECTLKGYLGCWCFVINSLNETRILSMPWILWIIVQDDEEAYAADTDSDTDDEERPIAAAAMATVLYSSEDEQATPRRPQVSSKFSQTNMKISGKCNRPFPSYFVPLIQNKSLCRAFHMQLNLIVEKEPAWERIFKGMLLCKDSSWHRSKR